MSQVFPEMEATTSKRYFSYFDIPPLVKSRLRPTYRVELRQGEDGRVVARSLDIKGAVSQGTNRDEALRNIVEAISVILEDTFGENAPEFFVIWEEER